MREALAARSGRDFVAAGPSPLAAGRGRIAAAAKSALLLLLRRPAPALGCAVMLAALAAVALNALAWQTARHPHPLFPAKPAASERRAAAPVPPPLPPARPAEVRPPAPPAAAAPPVVVVPVPPTKPAPGRDPIGDLIRSGETGASAAKESSPRVAAAQRALAKLGYGALKADGVIGPGTRQAIEKFERDRKLAVTGELGARTVRELSVQAGMPIE